MLTRRATRKATRGQSACAGGCANGLKQTAGSPVSPLAYNISLIAAVFAVVTRYPFTAIIRQRNTPLFPPDRPNRILSFATSRSIRSFPKTNANLLRDIRISSINVMINVTARGYDPQNQIRATSFFEAAIEMMISIFEYRFRLSALFFPEQFHANVRSRYLW